MTNLPQPGAPDSAARLRAGLARLRSGVDRRYLVLFAVLGGSYVGAAKLGIELSVAHGVITPVWAPTGIALAALVLFGGVLLAVDDRGPGVPEQEREAIFEIFNRGSAATSHVDGAGVGLSLVAQFTALHGGRARVEENPEGGASFCVLLPRSRPVQMH